MDIALDVALSAAVVPMPPHTREGEAGTLVLPDGRTLAFVEFGDPAGYPAFYFHGTPSSRLEGAFADHAARTHGFRLIAVDRPGSGQSSFQPDRVFGDWPDDVVALANHLGLGEFGIVGHSGAGPHLFVCGAVIDPARLRFVGGLGPWGPVASPEIMASLNPMDRFYAGLSQRMPWIMHAAFAPLGWCARFAPSLFFRIMKGAVPPADRHMLDDPTFEHHFRAVEFEAFRQGSRGPAHEATIAFRPWDFDIAEIRVPVHIWIGESDIFVPRRMGEYMERTIPGVNLKWVAGKGHFNIENWNDILAACARELRRVGGPASQ